MIKPGQNMDDRHDVLAAEVAELKRRVGVLEVGQGGPQPMPVPTPIPEPSNDRMAIGMNMSPWRYWEPEPIGVQRLLPLAKVVRFMNWQDTNGDGVGVDLAKMIAYANSWKANPWFCTYHDWDVQRVRQFAEQCRDNLDPDLTIYAEYSNEIWNGRFNQSQWIKANAGGLRGLPFIMKWAQYVKAHFDQWAEVFSGQEHRLIRVVAGQETVPWMTTNLCEQIGEGNFDAVASSAYFGVKSVDATDTRSAPQLIADALSQLDERGPNRIEHGELAKRFGVRYIGYECGHHITGKTQAVREAQKLRAMYDAYTINMQNFADAGGSLFVAFCWIKAEDDWPFGTLFSADQPIEQAAKYRALLDWTGNN